MASLICNARLWWKEADFHLKYTIPRLWYLLPDTWGFAWNWVDIHTVHWILLMAFFFSCQYCQFKYFLAKVKVIYTKFLSSLMRRSLIWPNVGGSTEPPEVQNFPKNNCTKIWHIWTVMKFTKKILSLFYFYRYTFHSVFFLPPIFFFFLVTQYQLMSNNFE